MKRTEAKKILNSFLELEKNWDSYGAEPLAVEIVEKAKTLLDELPNWGWVPAPGSDGSIQLETNHDGVDVEIMVAKPLIGGMYHCSNHGGYGFKSDCQICGNAAAL